MTKDRAALLDEFHESGARLPIPLRSREIAKWIRAKMRKLADMTKKDEPGDVEYLAAVRCYDHLARERQTGQR